MATVDSGAWLQEVSADAPAGPNLEFDPDFSALERSAQGKPDQQFGSVIIPAEEPEWKEVAAQAATLTDRTRDLRVLSLLAIARLHIQGFVAFSDVLTLIRQILETRWEQVHPQLDPDDDNDPTLRSNALLALGDIRRVVRFLREMPLASSPRSGAVSWHDISVAIGNIEPEAGKEKPKEAVIRGTFGDTDKDRLAALKAALEASAVDLVAIPAVFDTKSGYGTGPDFADLLKLLKEMQRFIERFAPATEIEAAPVEEAVVEAEAAPEGGAAVSTIATPTARAPLVMTATSLTSISTRSEALHLLGLVLQYYGRYEPSSPLPLLIDRARRLADKPFLDILRDLAPDGVSQAQHFAGSTNDAAV